MSALPPEQVEHVAHLARLELTPEERDRFAFELGTILGYVDRLSELDTEGVEPMVAVQPRSNVFRDDEPCEPAGVEAAMANAPEPQDGAFRIPRILP